MEFGEMISGGRSSAAAVTLKSVASPREGVAHTHCERKQSKESRRTSHVGRSARHLPARHSTHLLKKRNKKGATKKKRGR